MKKRRALSGDARIAVFFNSRQPCLIQYLYFPMDPRHLSSELEVWNIYTSLRNSRQTIFFAPPAGQMIEPPLCVERRAAA
jgi:hypothetical protein